MELNATSTRAKIIFGAIALFPLAVITYILLELFKFLKSISDFLTPYFGADPYLQTVLLIVLSVVSLVALCYAIGSLISTKIGALSYEKVESRVRSIIPGYEIIAGLLRGIAGNKMSYPPALVTLTAPGTAVLGFVMEDDNDPYLTVFVPTAPIMTAGAIHVVERSRVRLLEGTSMDAANCITQWGLGLAQFRGSAAPPKLS